MSRWERFKGGFTEAAKLAGEALLATVRFLGIILFGTIFVLANGISQIAKAGLNLVNPEQPGENEYTATQITPVLQIKVQLIQLSKPREALTRPLQQLVHEHCGILFDDACAKILTEERDRRAETPTVESGRGGIGVDTGFDDDDDDGAYDYTEEDQEEDARIPA